MAFACHKLALFSDLQNAEGVRHLNYAATEKCTNAYQALRVAIQRFSTGGSARDASTEKLSSPNIQVGLRMVEVGPRIRSISS